MRRKVRTGSPVLLAIAVLACGRSGSEAVNIKLPDGPVSPEKLQAVLPDSVEGWRKESRLTEYNTDRLEGSPSPFKYPHATALYRSTKGAYEVTAEIFDCARCVSVAQRATQTRNARSTRVNGNPAFAVLRSSYSGGPALMVFVKERLLLMLEASDAGVPPDMLQQLAEHVNLSQLSRGN